jgi:Transposase
VALEAAHGWAGWSTCWRTLTFSRTWSIPAAPKAIASARRKDDRVDAHTLAQLLRAELLPEAWIAPQAVRDQRALRRHRAWLGRLATAAKCRIHAVLADRGIPVLASERVGAGYSVTSCDLRILMDHPTQSIPPHDLPADTTTAASPSPEWRHLPQGTVRTVHVVWSASSASTDCSCRHPTISSRSSPARRTMPPTAPRRRSPVAPAPA